MQIKTTQEESTTEPALDTMTESEKPTDKGENKETERTISKESAEIVDDVGLVGADSPPPQNSISMTEEDEDTVMINTTNDVKTNVTHSQIKTMSEADRK